MTELHTEPHLDRNKGVFSFDFVEQLLKKTVFTFTRPLEAQVEELTHRIERLSRRIDRLSKKTVI